MCVCVCVVALILYHMTNLVFQLSSNGCCVVGALHPCGLGGFGREQGNDNCYMSKFYLEL